jgi:hypothetical protein
MAPAPPTLAPATPTADFPRPGRRGVPALVRVLVADERQDRPVSWQDIAQQTGLSRSRA